MAIPACIEIYNGFILTVPKDWVDLQVMSLQFQSFLFIACQVKSCLYVSLDADEPWPLQDISNDGKAHNNITMVLGDLGLSEWLYQCGWCCRHSRLRIASHALSLSNSSDESCCI